MTAYRNNFGSEKMFNQRDSASTADKNKVNPYNNKG
jgi:hypothetical protein